MNFKNNFNKFRQYSDYFNGLSDAEICELLDNSIAKIEAMGDLSQESKSTSAEVINATKQNIKLALNPKNINIKKLKKAFSELKNLAKSDLSDEDKQTVELVIGLVDLFIENNESMRNW